MRYIVAIASAALVLLFLGATTGFGEWPRPWGPLSRGAVGGVVAIGVLIIWEQLYPREDSLRDDEKTSLRDDPIAAEAALGDQLLPPSDEDGRPVVDDDGPASADEGTGTSSDEDPRA